MFKPSLDDAPLAIALGAARMRCGCVPLATMMAAWIAPASRCSHCSATTMPRTTISARCQIRRSEQTPFQSFKSIYAVLQDDHTGLFPLALAMLRPKLTKTEQQKLTDGPEAADH